MFRNWESSRQTYNTRNVVVLPLLTGYFISTVDMNKESSATNFAVVKTPAMRINSSYISILRLSSKQSPAGKVVAGFSHSCSYAGVKCIGTNAQFIQV